MSEQADDLMEAVDAAADLRGYPWVAGVLAGCVRTGWSEAQATEFLREAAKKAGR